MSKFILVHDVEDNASPTIINANNILYVKNSEKYTGASHIELNDIDIECTECEFDVTETREQIFEMLNS